MTIEVEWKTIFAIQEATHGYVGYEYDDYHIACPNCWKEVTNDVCYHDVGELFL